MKDGIDNAALLGETALYQRHYVLVVDDEESVFWQLVYENGKEEAASQGALLEILGSGSLR